MSRPSHRSRDDVGKILVQIIVNPIHTICQATTFAKPKKIPHGPTVASESKAKTVFALNASKTCGNQWNAVERQNPAKSLTKNDLC
jgi:hypothetical protein